jgi:hypothetical protein
MRLRIPSWPNLFRYLQYDLRFRLPLSPQKINQIKKHDVPDLYRSLHRICFYLEFCLQLCVDHKNVVVPEALQWSSAGQT